MDELGPDDCIDRRPAEACEATEDCDWIRGSENVRDDRKRPLTEFHSIVAKEESREDDLAQTELRSEGTKEADGKNTKEIDEEDCE